MATKPVAVREALAVWRAARLNDGWLRYYSGTPPANADAALSGNTLLAEARFANPAFTPGSSDGQVTLAANVVDTAADAGGVCTFARAFQADGTTLEEQYSVTLVGGGGDIQFTGTTTFVAGVTVECTSFTITGS